MSDPRAGQPAQPERPHRRRRPRHRVLHRRARPGRPAPAGRVRHLRAPRLEPRRRLQRGAHPGHHPGDLRVPRRAGLSTARCSSAATPTPCPSRPGPPRWRCWPPTTSRCSSTPATGYTPTPAVSHAILRANRGRQTRAGLADGIVVTPSHNPPARRRLQVQPAARRPGRHRRHRLDRRPRQRAARAPGSTASAGSRSTRARPRPSSLRLPRHLRRRPADVARPRRDPRRRRADRRRPAGRRERRLLGRDRRAAPARPHRGQPAGRPDLAVHDAGLGRQDPDGLLVAVGDGLAGRRARTSSDDRRPATTPTPTGTASSPPTAG